MGFKLAVNPQYNWPVEVLLPESGRMVKHVFEATFRGVTRSEAESLLKRYLVNVSGPQQGDAAATEGEQVVPMSEDELIHDVMVGWAKILGDDNKPIEFSPEGLEKLLDYPGARPAIVKAFFESLPKANLKN